MIEPPLPAELLTELASMRGLLDEIGAYIFTKDLHGRYTYANRYVLALFGTTLEQTLGRDDREFFDQARSAELWENDRRVLEQGETIEREEVNYLRDSGEQRIYWSVKKPVRNAAGEIVGMCGISTDITERKRLAAKLDEQRQLLETILNNVGAYIYMKDRQRRFLYVNPMVARLLGRPPEAITGRYDVELMAKADAELLSRLDDKVFRSGRMQAGEESFPDQHGKLRHYWSIKVPLPSASGKPEQLIGFSSDITELHDLKEQLQQLSITDSLTGLFNRRHFFALAEKEVARTRRHKLAMALMIIDIDHFKRVNDQYGHPVGDCVLREVGQIMQSMVRLEDTLARVGGEEFAILLPSTQATDAHALAERLREQIAAATQAACMGTALSVTVSIGLAHLQATDTRFDGLYTRADQMLYQAKHDGRDRLCAEPGL